MLNLIVLLKKMKAYCINLIDRPERWIKFKTQSFPFEVERFNAIRDLPGWKGCTRSHLKLMSDITDFPCVIFEDDCLMLHPWSEVDYIMTQLPDNWDMLYLGATLNEPIERYSDNLFKLKNAYTTHCIIYRTPAVFDYILENKENIRKIDVFITQQVHPKFNCYISYPMLATQRPGISDVLNIRKFVDYSEMNESYRRFTQC